MPAWSLPEAIADVLPAEARRIEALRRSLLDLFAGYGYELVMPPMLEYVESLLSGSGRDLDLQMFKLVDQMSGRTMGLRADITPQSPVPLAGYSGRSGLYTAVESRLEANAILLRQGEAQVLFVAVDLLYFGPELTRIVQARADQH